MNASAAAHPMVLSSSRCASRIMKHSAPFVAEKGAKSEPENVTIDRDCAGVSSRDAER